MGFCWGVCYSYGEVKINRVVVICKGQASGEEFQVPNPMGLAGFSIQHRKWGWHFIVEKCY